MGNVQGEKVQEQLSGSRGTASVAVVLCTVVQINDPGHASDRKSFHRHTPVCYNRFCGMCGNDRDLRKEVWCGEVR